jgi:hypothetical protein
MLDGTWRRMKAIPVATRKCATSFGNTWRSCSVGRLQSLARQSVQSVESVERSAHQGQSESVESVESVQSQSVRQSVQSQSVERSVQIVDLTCKLCATDHILCRRRLVSGRPKSLWRGCDVGG